MSNVIDRGVVEMTFDNSQFEKNVKTSMTTIDDLKKSLNFDKSSNALNSLSESASRFNMSNVADAAESVKNKFSALEVIGVGALLRIGQQAVDTGEKLIKSMSTDQIIAGWDKFAKKTTSTATLLAQGFGIDEVNEQLDKLNWFTDETSYNFIDMVDSIGKFTASGKNLEESVDAMQGIANWAALSGQNAATASRAMYQLSQAMGAGIMRKEDYKSIQNANMDTDEFRQKALDAAVALGTLKEVGVDSYESLVASSKKGAEAFSKAQFAEKLTEGLWFTDDVMMAVFNDYSKGIDEVRKFADEHDLLASEIIGAKEALDKGDDALRAYVDDLDILDGEKAALMDMVRGLDDFAMKAFSAAQKARTFSDAIDSVKDAASTTWMRIFQVFIGDTEQATELWTDLANYLYDVFVEPLNSLEEFFGDLINGPDGLAGNRDKIIDVFRNIASVFESITKPIKEAFSAIFPDDPNKAANFGGFLDKLNEIIKSLKLSIPQTEKVKDIFAGLFSIVKIGIGIISKFLKTLSPFVKILNTIFNGLLDILSKVGVFLTNLSEVDDYLNNFEKVLLRINENFKDIFEINNQSIKELIDNIKNGENVAEAVGKFIFDSLSKISINVSKTIEDIIEILTGNKIDKISTTVEKYWGDVYTTSLGYVDKIKKDIAGKRGVQGACEIMIDASDKFGQAIIDIAEKITGKNLDEMRSNFNSAIEFLKDGLKRISDLISKIKSKEFKVDQIIPKEVLDAIKSFKDKFEKFKPVLTRVKELASNVFKVIGNGLNEGIKLIGNLIKRIVDAPLLSTLNLSMIVKEIIKAKNWSELGGTFTELKNLFSTTGESIKNVSKNINMVLKNVSTEIKNVQKEVNAKYMFAIAAAITAFALSLIALSLIDPEKIKMVIGGFAAEIGSIAGAVGVFAWIASKLGKSGMVVSTSINNITKNFKEVKKNFTAANMIGIAGIIVTLGAAVLTMSKALLNISEAYQSPEQMESTLVAFAGMLVALIIVTGLLAKLSKALTMKEITNMTMISVVFDILASSLKKIAKAYNVLEGMDPYNMLTSFAVIIFGLFGLVGALTEKLAKVKNNKMVGTAAALLLMAMALKPLAEAIKMLSKIEPEKLLVPTIAIMFLLETLGKQAWKMSGKSGLLQAGLGLIGVALALKVLSDAIIKLSSYSFDELLTGFIVITSLFIVIGAFAKTLGPDLLKVGAGFLLIAASLYVITKAMNMLYTADPLHLGVAFTILAGAVAGLSFACQALTDNLKGAASLLVVAVAIRVLASAIKLLASCDIPSVIASAGMLILTMVALTIVAGAAQGSLGGAAALLVLSTAFIIFAGALAILSMLNPVKLLANVGTAILSFLAILMVVTTAAALMTTMGTVVLPGLLLIFATLVAVGVGMAAFGAGLIVTAIGIEMLSETSSMAGEAITNMLTAFNQNMVALVGFGATMLLVGAAFLIAGVGAAVLAVGVAALAVAIAVASIAIGIFSLFLLALTGSLSLFTEISGAAGTALVTFANCATQALGGISLLAIELLSLVIPTLALGVASIVLGAGLLVLGVGATVAAVGVTLLAASLGLVLLAVTAFIEVISPLLEIISKSAEAGLGGMGDIGENAADSLISGFSSRIILGYELVRTACTNLMIVTASSMITAVQSILPVIQESGTAVGKEFSESLTKSMTESLNQGQKNVADAGNKLSEVTKKYGENSGMYMGAGYQNGLVKQRGAIMNTAMNIARGAYMAMRSYLKINSPSKMTEDLGKWTDLGFVNGMEKNSNKVSDSAENVADVAINSMTNGLQTAYDNLGSDISDPVIKPVIDMSDVQNGASQINSMFGKDYASSIATTYKSNGQRIDEANAANAGLLSSLNGQLVNAITSNSTDQLPVNVNVTLAGDAEGIFRLVLNENTRLIKQYGASPLLR